jgi:hypothetical protein
MTWHADATRVRVRAVSESAAADAPKAKGSFVNARMADGKVESAWGGATAAASNAATMAPLKPRC